MQIARWQASGLFWKSRVPIRAIRSLPAHSNQSGSKVLRFSLRLGDYIRTLGFMEQQRYIFCIMVQV